MKAPANAEAIRGQPPRSNPRLVGHEAAERMLLRAYASKRLHHAWLLGGPQGIGKATLAFRFARFLLAARPGAPESLEVDPGDPVFRRVAAGSHPDLLTIERGVSRRGTQRSEIVIDDARQIGSFLQQTPAEGGWRVVVIDSADELNPNAANALLKLLEEPPAKSLLLLVSHNPGRLLPTIRSRCRHLTLRPLTAGQTVGIVRDQRPDLDEDTAALLARLSEGSPGGALALAEQGGADLFRALIELLESLPALDLAGLHAFAERFAPAAPEPFRGFAGLLFWWLARLIRAAAEGGAGRIDEALPGEARLLSRLAVAAPLDRWCELWEKIGHLVARADALNLDRRQVVLDVFLALQAVLRPAGSAAA